MVHAQVTVVTVIKVNDTGRWAHINIKLYNIVKTASYSVYVLIFHMYVFAQRYCQESQVYQVCGLLNTVGYLMGKEITVISKRGLL